jgi:hypothetical protein
LLPSKDGRVAEMEALADRKHVYRGAPRWVIFRALTDDRAKWLRSAMHAGEVVPDVLESVPDQRVVWSSFWPISPSDTIEFTQTEQRAGDTTLRLQWFSRTPPDERGIGFTRQRLNTKLGGDIRGWLADDNACRGQ